MKRIAGAIKRNATYFFYYLLLKICKEKYLAVKASVPKKKGRIAKYNWGDDINIYFLEKITGRKVLLVPEAIISKRISIPFYMCIGSIITFFRLNNGIIWGSGIINQNQIDEIKGRPMKICAVRGPKTRNLLLEKGMACPEIYGDPAMLLPFVYKKQLSKEYSLGIIPHFIDVDCGFVNNHRDEVGVKIIRVQDYTNWTDFIDDICKCEMILSSSLHGLIISETYGVPNIWAKFGEYVEGWDFKFQDYYESIGKEGINPVLVDGEFDVGKLREYGEKWDKGTIDLKPLIDACPFTINLHLT